MSSLSKSMSSYELNSSSLSALSAFVGVFFFASELGNFGKGVRKMLASLFLVA